MKIWADPCRVWIGEGGESRGVLMRCWAGLGVDLDV